MAKQLSRTQRWAQAAAEAVAALNDLQEVQSEYQDWLDNLPDSLQDGVVAEKLNAVCDLDIQGALDTVEEAEGIDLPLGFGRD